MGRRRELLKIYDLLNEHFGDLKWWPADTPFEVMVGAILTQNTAWSNVQKAIGALKEKDLLSPAAMMRIEEGELALLIKPSGCYRVKASRLKSLVQFLFDHYSGDIAGMYGKNPSILRKQLLAVPGVGAETADSIMLYACRKPVFVTDAYTKRILQRHGLVAGKADGNEIRALFMDHLPRKADLFNQFHALLVQTGKVFCRPQPKCHLCPLREFGGRGGPPRVKGR